MRVCESLHHSCEAHVDHVLNKPEFIWYPILMCVLSRHRSDVTAATFPPILPSQASKHSFSLPSHPHVQLGFAARRVAMRKGREAQQPGGHPHRRYKGTTPYATPEQSADYEKRLASLCVAFQAELVEVEAKVAACVLANKVRDDHYNAAGYSADNTTDMCVDARHAIERDSLVLWLQSFSKACELSTTYLLQSLQTPDVELETVFGYFGPIGKWREARESKSMYYEPGSDPPIAQSVVQALAAVSEVCLLVGLRAAINHATGGLFHGDSLPHIDRITHGNGLMLNVIGSYNTSTDLPTTEVLACGGKFVTGGYNEGSMGTFETGMYAGPMGCTMSRWRRAQFDLMAYQKKLVWNAVPTRSYPNGSYVQTNSVFQLQRMPPSGARCMTQYIGVVVEAITAVRSLFDQSTITQTWVSSRVPNCCEVNRVCLCRITPSMECRCLNHYLSLFPCWCPVLYACFRCESCTGGRCFVCGAITCM